MSDGEEEVIKCYICRRPVDEWEVCSDFLKDTLVVTVRCHGARETSQLDMQHVLDGLSIIGVAFKPASEIENREALQLRYEPAMEKKE